MLGREQFRLDFIDEQGMEVVGEGLHAAAFRQVEGLPHLLMMLATGNFTYSKNSSLVPLGLKGTPV